ncbi:MAG: hypothetical protein JO334_17580 [Verrucomicrobia bacterium]|nr:hypothetical protein [Verrucomicrobiota bacterium]
MKQSVIGQETRMDEIKSAEEPVVRDESPEGNKAEKEAKAAADAKAEELRIALETKTEQGKSTLGDLPKSGD